MSKIRLFGELELEAIAKILGDSIGGLTHNEITRTLDLCGIEDMYDGLGSKKERIHESLKNQQKIDSNGKSVIMFIMAAMNPIRYIGSEDIFESMRSKMNKLLAFSGLMLKEDGKIRTVPVANDKGRKVLIHMIPEFSEELSEVFKIWNGVQNELHFTEFKVKRDIEVKLLSKGQIKSIDGINLAAKAKKESGHLHDEIVVVFTEKRLYDDKHHQLYFMGAGPASIISLNFTKKFFGKDANSKKSVFQAVLINILATVSHKYDMDSHDKTNVCVMDFLNNMPDIQDNIDLGPRYCDRCCKVIKSHNLQFLPSLACATRNIENIKSMSEKVSKKLFLDKVRLDEEGKQFEYDVVLSFAGEDRGKAEPLAKALRDKGIKVFCDSFEKYKWWGKDLYVYLSDIYRIKGKYCIMFLSEHYAKKLWTNHEREAAQARAFKENKEYILPIRVDETHIPGILDTTGYLKWDDETVDSITDCVIKKLGQK